MTPSLRAQIITRRTYNRPLPDGSFETWPQTVARAISHQRWLWERAQGGDLTPVQEAELQALERLQLDRKAFLAGRTLWLGGTEISRERAISNFNCTTLRAATINDLVDIFWCLLNGAGVGSTPAPGALYGFLAPIEEIQVIRSTRTDRGAEHNAETFEDGVWTIRVGDSALAWAKALGKLVAHPYLARKLVLDFTEIRPAGERLRGYGWISSGDANISKAFTAIATILNRKTGRLLDHIDILDIFNWMGTVLSSRRSAELALYPYGGRGWEAFADAKLDYWKTGNPQRAQSNNSLAFYEKPSKSEIRALMDRVVANGGSEPGFFNMEELQRRAPWAELCNPCGEQLLSAEGGVCCLTEVVLPAFDNPVALHEATRLIARANYRQTCVDFDDGLLQAKWNHNNAALHLCGVGITGVAQVPDFNEHDYRTLRNVATAGAYEMARELGKPMPKHVTTLKPSGTLSKVADCTEGTHKPLGRYILNNVVFSHYDPLVALLREAGYRTFNHPFDEASVLITLPVEYSNVPFETAKGKPVNLEPAIAQLERYRTLMRYWCDTNVSCTVSYDKSEVGQITDWLDKHWDDYVGVSFLFRNDPTKTAEDLGYPYLPQNVVTEKDFKAYVAGLKPVDIGVLGAEDTPLDDECASGACPVR